MIVFSDHGGCLPREKGLPFWTGHRVPLIVYVPPKWQQYCAVSPGTVDDRLVGFDDLAVTLCHVAGVDDVPLEGTAFLTNHAAKKPYQFGFHTNQGNHFDPVRTVSNGHYRYLRCFVPHKPFGLRQSYQMSVPSHWGMDREYREGRLPERFHWFYEPKATEYLFDLQQDPYEQNNLAGDAAFEDVLQKMRAVCREEMQRSGDLGLIPGFGRPSADERPLIEQYGQKPEKLSRIHDIAWMASEGNPENVASLISALASDEAEVQFWAASGLATLAQRGTLREVPEPLQELLKHGQAAIRATVAETFCYLGDESTALEVLLEDVESGSEDAASSMLTLAERGFSQEGVSRIRKLQGLDAIQHVLASLGEIPISDLFSVNQVKRDRMLNSRRPKPRVMN